VNEKPTESSLTRPGIVPRSEIHRGDDYSDPGLFIGPFVFIGLVIMVATQSPPAAVALAMLTVVTIVIWNAYERWVLDRLEAVGVVADAVIESEVRDVHGDNNVTWHVGYRFSAGDKEVRGGWARDVDEGPWFRLGDTRPVIYDPKRPGWHGRVGDW
jgi:hypothetical protein